MRLLAIIMWSILLHVTSTQATEPLQEMILLRRENPAPWSARYGDLYLYSLGDSTSTRLTTLGNITAPALSPDGQTIAYAAISESTMTDAADGTYTFDPDQADPLDIWIMDVTTHEFTRIAAQPNQDSSTYRSNPVWSPDSQQLAWFTWDGSSEGGSVIIYDRATGKERVAATQLMMNANDVGRFNLANLIGWGGQIAHMVFRRTNNDQALWLETIDKNGKVGRKIIAHTDYLPRIMWVKHQDSWWIATQNMDDEWQLIQPETQQQNELASPPILQLPDGTGAKLKPVSSGWEILSSDGDSIAIPFEGLAALSPDGKAVVYLRERKAFLWREGQAITPLLPGDAVDWEIITLIWTPMVWVTNS